MVLFLLFLQIELQRSSSYKVLESLFIFVLSFPLLLLNVVFIFSSIMLLFTFICFFSITLILLCRKFPFKYFQFLKIVGPLKPANREKEGNLLSSVSTMLAFWHNHHTSVVFQAHHILE